MNVAGCELCEHPGGLLVHRADDWRVVRVVDTAFPGFYRVIWNTHVAEFTDLDSAGRRVCMDVVAAVEQVLREQLRPTKINLASLGNVVPHLHWHVIARFDWDSHFPQPVWGSAQSRGGAAAENRLPLALVTLDARMVTTLAALPPLVRD